MTAVPLEDALVDLGAHLDAPAGDALALRVGARVRARRAPRTRRRLVIVFALLVLLVLALSLAPAVGEWLGIRGVEVRQEPPPSTVTTATTATTTAPAGAGTALDLGVPTTVRAAAAQVGFTPVVPSVSSGLGAPVSVWLDTRPLAPIVTLVYGDGTLVAQFRAAIADDVVLQKFAGPGVRVEALDIDGRRALWIEGTHAVAVRRGVDEFIDELRLSDSALVVEVGELTVRIETPAGRDAAVKIARNLVASAGVEAP